MSLIRNEQTKLRATYLNGLAIAVFAVGGLAPVFSYAFGSIADQTPWVVLVVSVICIAGSAALHMIALNVLRELVP